MRIISISNQKGGVGKTTTAINLATALAACGKNTLIIDIDPQGNASTGLGVSVTERDITIYDILLNNMPIAKALLKTKIPKLYIIPASVDLSGAEIELINKEMRHKILADALDNFVKQQDTLDIKIDYVLIDCPPSFGLMTINALCASQAVLIPLQCEFFALEGLSQILLRIKDIKERFNPKLELQGVVLTMYDKRNRLSTQVEANVRTHLGKLVYDVVIPRNVRLSEAPSHGTPALVYDINCPGSKAYLKLASELITRERSLLEE